MYALVDATSFYASAEKVFDPTIRKKPVVVLSNNDGCIVAASPEARALGIPKFEPYFKLRQILEQNGVIIRSSNYELYADLSDKMMAVIGQFCDQHYVYSIDEAFLKFDGYSSIVNNWYDYGQLIRRTVWQSTKLPVGVGFGPTPTLAKAANHAAKKFAGATGVAVIHNEQSRKTILSRMATGDVWGIGKRLSKKLSMMGIETALDLAKQSPKHMRKQFSVVLERTIEELNGNTCLSWDEVKQRKKEIYSTRSFGERVTTPAALKASLITHCSVVTKKLRQQQSLAKRIIVFAHSSPHEDGYFKKSFIQALPIASADSMVFANAVEQVFRELFKPGVRYYKSGIGAIELEDDNFQHADMFNASQDNPELMKTIDDINKRYGITAARLGSEVQNNDWIMKREFLSPRYTTRWPDIPRIKC
ncbi:MULTISPECIES: Y-family DNA polymerase [unclassified Pseudoalteromonas]|uniref:Y-family DNA polymerase n=1 Tax=unclassified Pseudoalteromonas TaxID=194690 RepID=UPI001F29E062|nr:MULTISPECIES: Y-family DNA polymerase [unclassified Pseudoalteromonas]MCF2827094.1 Y-family DNA polymerase [Pseudoalteromonas sp. OF5H-5]MCF2832056.1 Y-family DNA polymerase [Pseudoalteromonas sp. DL2-H6]MCF2925893.1 Y-family DNA polymerase [Pseudoalteromonas sp. DL2-H1]